MNEKTLHSELLFEGEIIRVKKDTVALTDGHVTTREIVEHRPAVVILPYNSSDEVYLIEQFRKPCEKVILEAPAGMMEAGENPLEAAKRELKEETGFDATDWTLVSEFYPAPGFCDEYLYVFLAKGLIQGDTHMDVDERIELVKTSITKLDEQLKNRSLIDAKTIIATFFLKQKEGAGC